MIFWGPPGVGKTTLSNLIATELDRPFYTLSAISSGVKDVREVIDKASKAGMFGHNNAILFIDEIHRFSKAQQDSLLGAVEKGVVTLIGATTENPSFEVISALLSRCQVYTLKPFSKDELEELLNRAVKLDPQLQSKNITLKETQALLKYSGGDGRKLLNLLEQVVMSSRENVVTNELVEKCAKEQVLKYDKDGEQHYDIISAFIKSIRGSDVNATLYWLARMLVAGEDIKFIARRMIISASEDIGLANPTALVIANAAFDSVTKIGMPEARLVLSQAAIYLANSPKGNTSYLAINEAMSLVKQTGNLEVPLHLRNAPTQLMKELNYGTDYKYSHDYPGNFVNQEFMPEEIKGTNFIKPGSSSREKEVGQNLLKLWKGKY